MNNSEIKQIQSEDMLFNKDKSIKFKVCLANKSYTIYNKHTGYIVLNESDLANYHFCKKKVIKPKRKMIDKKQINMFSEEAKEVKKLP